MLTYVYMNHLAASWAIAVYKLCTTILDDLMIELDVGHDPWQEEIPKTQKQASEDVASVGLM